MNKTFWIGSRESDILYTNNYFEDTICIFGTGNSFSQIANKRINHNKQHDDVSAYFVKQIEETIKKNPDCKFMYYNPYQAYKLPSEIRKHVICLNQQELLMNLRDKVSMRLLASKHIPIVPFQEVAGDDVISANSEGGFDTDALVVQESISAGGDGTYIVKQNKLQKFKHINPNKKYLISPYYEKNIPVNINFIIYKNDIVVFPPSIQIVNPTNNKILFMGSDYQASAFLSSEIKKIINVNCTLLAKQLQKRGYRGIGGFDFLIVNGSLLFLECNCRFQASTVLLNFALTKCNLPSVHEMNASAFKNEVPSPFDYYNMQIPYAIISYINNGFHKEQNTSCNGIEQLILDGYDKNQLLEEHAYTYRIIYNKSICSITDFETLNLFPNVLDDSKEWYEKIKRNDLLALKISLLNQGVSFTPRAHERQLELGGVKAAVFESVDLYLHDSIWVNCPYDLNFSSQSPYLLDYIDEEGFVLKYYGDKVCKVNLQTIDTCSDLRSKTGIRYASIAYLAGDRLRIYHNSGCHFKTTHKECKFCNLIYDDKVFDLADVREVIDYYEANVEFSHYLIGGGSEPIEKEAENIIRIAKYIRQRSKKNIYVMCLPPESSDVLYALYDAGVTEIAFNIEIFDRKIAREIMPGKGQINLSQYINALVEARKIWNTSYAVRSLLIAGIEPQESFIAGVERLCSLGIMPIISVFRPLPNTKMNTLAPMNNEGLYELYQRLDAICKKYNQHLGPDCIICQNNTLSLPW